MNASQALNGQHIAAAPKARKARSSAAKPQPEVIHAQTETERKLSAMERFLAAQEEMMREWDVPSAKRALVAFVSGITVAIGAGFIGGVLLETITMVVLTLTSSALLAFIAYALGLLALLYAGGLVAGHTYAYVASKKVDEHIELVKDHTTRGANYVRGLFGGKDV